MKKLILSAFLCLAQTLALAAQDKNETLENFLFKMVETLYDREYNEVLSPEYPGLESKDRKTKAPEIAKAAGIWRKDVSQNLKSPLSTQDFYLLANGFVNHTDTITGELAILPYMANQKAFEAKIKNLSTFKSPFKEAVVSLYARGLIDLPASGILAAPQNITEKQTNEFIQLFQYGKSIVQEKTLTRYLEVMGKPKAVDLDPKKNTYSITFTSQGSELPVRTELTLNQTGLMTYQRGEIGAPLPPSRTHSFTTQEVQKLFDLIINKELFFLLPTSLTADIVRMDVATSFISVNYNGKVRKVGGYDAQGNKHFNALWKAINDLTISYTEGKN